MTPESKLDLLVRRIAKQHFVNSNRAIANSETKRFILDFMKEQEQKGKMHHCDNCDRDYPVKDIVVTGQMCPKCYCET